MPKIRKKYITSDIDERYYSIINNINDDFSHQRINNAEDSNSTEIKSGVLSSSKGKYLKLSNSEHGTLPSVLQTTGKVLQDYNDPFDDTNILEYKSLLSNSNVGLPLITLTQSNGSQQVNVGHYITTDSNLITNGTISKDSSHYVSKYDLSNTKIFDSPNYFDNHMKHDNSTPVESRRNIKSDIDEILLHQTRFKEEYKPYVEDFSNFVIPEHDDEFYYNTIDYEISESYNLGKQRQIKIVLDFSNNDSVDLTLLNTKMTFNLPQDIESSNFTEDNLITTKYINFIEGDENSKYSFSSHFLPTAYWNFQKNRWNYLDGNLLDFDNDQESNLNLSDFPVEQNSDIKFSYLGAKNTTGESTSISPNFIYNSSTLQSQTIRDRNLKNNVLSVYNKPIVTTPSFRPDGSMNLENLGSQYNKTPISKITNTYGFPYKQNWQPTNDHLLNMSRYIANDFLLEKVSIKGKFTSQGEMPNKKGNFSSGYRQESSILSNSEFSDSYDHKDDFDEYVSNSLTFFILNERKGFNHVKQGINADPLQSYFFSKNFTNLTQELNYYNVKGKKLESYLGDYTSYENYQDTLSVYSQIVPNTFIYNIDEFNNIELNSSYIMYSNSKEVRNNNKQNIFHFLENSSTSSPNEIVDHVYVKKIDGTNDIDILSDNTNKKYNICIESLSSNDDITLNNFNLNSGREIVTYSNFLIAGKKDNISFDKETMLNIDNSKIINFNSDNKVNINLSESQEFQLDSFLKNTHESDYTDESVYKIKSNFKEEVVVREEELSSINIEVPKEIGTIITTKPLFEFDETNTDSDKNGNRLFKILGMPDKNNGLGGYDSLSEWIDDSSNQYHGLTGNIITNDLSECLFLNSILSEIKLKDPSDNQIKESNILIYFTYNNSATNGQPYRAEHHPTSSNIPSTINMQDFISYSKTTHTIIDEGSAFNTNIFFNLRFLDPFEEYGISNEFFNFGFAGFNKNHWGDFYDWLTTSKGLDIDFSPKVDITTPAEAAETNTWSNSSDQVKLTNFLKFVYIGIFNAPVYNSVDGSAITSSAGAALKLNSFIEFNTEDVPFIKVKDSYDTDSGTSAEFSFYESNLNPYTSSFNDNNQTRDFFVPDLDLSTAFVKIFNINNNLRGLPKVSNNEEFYNINNVLEGRSFGDPNNLGIISERIIDRKKNKNPNKLEYSVKTNSGKEIKSAGSLNFIENNTYLLKPEDNLIFGVSSNCNGEVMPTVVTLHDKLEITLTGREFITNKKHRTNECKSIRKVITGDNDIKRLGNSIYQTEGSYFDTIWNKSESFNNLKVFNTKFQIGKNSSRNFGTYSGVLSFDKVFNNKNEVIYQADTVHPSVANVYLSENCLNKKQLYSIDSRDRYEFSKESRLENIDSKSLLKKKLPSYKMIFSDSIDQEFLLNYPNRYSKVATDWHNTFHLKKYKEFFQDSKNKKIIDYSYNISLEKNQENSNSNHFIYFDINSYSAGLNYESYVSLFRKYIENGNKKIVEDEFSANPLYDNSEYVTNSIPRYYKSLKTYMLPFSKHYLVQNSLEIKNNGYLNLVNPNKARYINNYILIQQSLENYPVFNIENYSIQYLLHDIEPEYCDISNDVEYSLFGPHKNGYSSGWCIVIETNLSVFNNLLQSLNNEDYDLFKSNKKEVRQESDGFTVKYYENNMFLNISERPQDFSDISQIEISRTVTKNFKFIKKVYDDVNTETEYFLVTPLHFWETMEIDISLIQASQSSTNNIFERELDSSIENSLIGFGRKSSQYNDGNQLLFAKEVWYAKLNDNTNIGSSANSSNIYEEFLILPNSEGVASYENTKIHPPETINRKITITGRSSTEPFNTLPTLGPIGGVISNDSKFVPMKFSELKASGETSVQNLAIERNILLSFSNFTLKENTNTNNSYSSSSSLVNKLDNNFILNKTKKYFISNELFNNNLSVLNEKNKNSLLAIDEDDSDYNINEKIYLSNCKNVIDAHTFDTNSNFVYKIKNIFAGGGGDDITGSFEYNIIELKGLYNNFTIFRKNKVLEQELIFDFESKNKLRVYEDELLKNVNSYSIPKELNTPYYEMLLSSNLTTDVTMPASASDNILQIPYAHYKIDNNFNPQSIDSSLNVEITDTSPTTNNGATSPLNTSSGSPIFRLSENPEGYDNKSIQEEKTKEFLYGFSRGKHRYPIQRLDGFKYGVECGSKKSLNYHFKNNSYGQFSDKIMGSTNFATARLDRKGNTIFDRAVEKRFVNEYFEFVSTESYEEEIRNNEDVYNKDRFCRSFYPYIEDASNELSQLNSGNSYYVESLAF